jgi:heme o synthase
MDWRPVTIKNSCKQALAILQRYATAQMELVMSLFMTVEMLIQSFAAMSGLWRGFREMVPRLIMKTSSAQPQFVSWSSIVPRVVHFAALMKPRVMLLSVFTAAVGLMIAPTHVDPILGTIAILAIAGGAGAAGALNMWYDADIDSVMTRTAMRPIPRGKVSRLEALFFGVILATISVAVLGLVLNVTAAALLATAILFYVVVYTVWLKRRTPQNIVIGGAAGALPPVIGWAAATGDIGIEPLVLFLIIFLWTPPHFWALSLNRSDEYARASVPILPVVSGSAATARQILIYSILLVPVSTLPTILGFAGSIYGATAVLCGAILLMLARQIGNRGDVDRRAARRLFAFSIFHLFLLFAALLIGSSSRGAVCSGLAPAQARAWFSPQACQGSREFRESTRSQAGHERVTSDFFAQSLNIHYTV